MLLSWHSKFLNLTMQPSPANIEACLIFWWKDDWKFGPFFPHIVPSFCLFYKIFFSVSLVGICIETLLFSLSPFKPLDPFWLLLHGPFILIFFSPLGVGFFFHVSVRQCVHKKKVWAHVSLAFSAFTCMHAHCRVQHDSRWDLC